MAPSRTSRSRALVAVLALSLSLAGCSGADSGGDSGSPTTEPPVATTSTPTSSTSDATGDDYTLPPDSLATLVTNEIQTAGEIRGAIVDCGTEPVTLVDEQPVDACTLVAPPPVRPLTVTPSGVSGGAVSLEVTGLD